MTDGTENQKTKVQALQPAIFPRPSKRYPPTLLFKTPMPQGQ